MGRSEVNQPNVAGHMMRARARGVKRGKGVKLSGVHVHIAVY